MKPGFSLDSTVKQLASPLPSEDCSGKQPAESAANGNGKTLPLLVRESAKATEVIAELLASLDDQSLPTVLTTDEENNPTGQLSARQLLAWFFAAANRQSALLATLLDTMSEAITVVDAGNIVQFWNQAAETIYEISREQVLGTPLDRHFSSESIRLLDALRHGTTVHRVYHIPRPDRHVLINAAPVRMDDEIIGAVSIEQDITELVRLNEELSHTTTHLHHLQQEINRKQAADDPFYAIKGHSASIQAVIRAAKKVAQTDATVLISGESGVGKELFAKAIHQASKRRDKPFVAINCGAIPAALFESELFGYHRGAFTGAEKKGKPGKLELAHGGTLFLDEIGELPLDLQVKLLRALQEKQFYRIGGTEPITVNTRIIAATNRQLEKMMAEGRFREDLYYRLNVFSLEIPPLRERPEDLLELVQLFLHEYSVSQGQAVPRISPEVMQALFSYHWPGNIREVRNVIERLSILQENGVILPEHLPAAIREHAASPPGTSPSVRDAAYPLPSSSRFARIPPGSEWERIQAALERTYGNKKAAAELLGISRGTLYNKLKKYEQAKRK
mgnify:CR=1 FL=1